MSPSSAIKLVSCSASCYHTKKKTDRMDGMAPETTKPQTLSASNCNFIAWPRLDSSRGVAYPASLQLSASLALSVHAAEIAAQRLKGIALLCALLVRKNQRLVEVRSVRTDMERRGMVLLCCVAMALVLLSQECQVFLSHSLSLMGTG